MKRYYIFGINDDEALCGLCSLTHNPATNRYGVFSINLWTHCGSTFQAFINGEWVETRAECNSGSVYIMHSNGWYLVNFKDTPFEGLVVRRGVELQR